MGTKIHCESYLPVFYSMRGLNEDSSSSSWPVLYGDKTLLSNGKYYNGFVPRSLVDGYPGHDKDVLKQKMLEHEAVFKNQVLELHRLYRIQRDMMQKVHSKEINENRASMEPVSSSSSLHGSQARLDEAQKWHMAGFPLHNPTYGSRTSIRGVEIVNSPVTCVKTNATQPGRSPIRNRPTPEDHEGPRPLKVRKKFDLRLPADDYIDFQEGDDSKGRKESDILGYALNCNSNGGPGSGTRLLFGLKGSNGLADLNEPVRVEALSSVDFFDRIEKVEMKGVNVENVRVGDGFSVNSDMGIKVNTRGRQSHICEAGPTRANIYSATQSPRPDKLLLPSHPVQGIRNQVHHPTGTYPNGYYNSREDMWRDGPQPFVGSSCFATSWAQSVSTWAKPTSSSSAQNAITSETCLKPLFYQRSEPTSKEVQFQASDRSSNHVFGIFPKGSCHAGSKPAIDINLNEVLSDEIVVLQDLNEESEPKDYVSALPWLKPKPVKDSNFGKKDEISETRPVKKILGIPIFEKSRKLENGPLPIEERKNGLIDINVACESDELISSQEPTFNEEKSKNGAVVRDHIIDLNSCISDCEDDPPAPNYERKAASVKITLEIDLEVPVFPESEDDNSTLSKENVQDEVHSQPLRELIKTADEVLQNAAETMFAISSSSPHVDSARPETSQAEADEVLRTAAETILAISSSGLHVVSDRPETSLAEALLWFADTVSSSRTSGVRNHSCREMDDFEAMTLAIAETKEDGYMPPGPFGPKIEEENGVNASLGMRSRRGQSRRRGRQQRRDFQRDILPGLTSLSRHEVTEDLQIFGGLMRATGHSWNSGLTRRRKGGGRGRRRAVVVVASPVCVKQVNNNNNNRVVEGLEDRSLTGWGKTTRRPRRQRCPSGNNVSTAVLTRKSGSGYLSFGE